MPKCNFCQQLAKINQRINLLEELLKRRKAKHAHRFQRLAQIEVELEQLQALQKENPTKARELTIKNKAKEQANIRSFLNVLGNEIEKGIQNQRERESFWMLMSALVQNQNPNDPKPRKLLLNLTLI